MDRPPKCAVKVAAKPGGAGGVRAAQRLHGDRLSAAKTRKVARGKGVDTAAQAGMIDKKASVYVAPSSLTLAAYR